VRAGMLAYCVGIILAIRMPLPVLTPFSVYFLLLLVAVVAFILTRCAGRYRHLLIVVIGLLLGTAWHMWWAIQLMSQRLPPHLEGIDLQVSGQIISLPQQRGPGQPFQFRVNGLDSVLPGRRLLLQYYGAERMYGGQHWRFTVRLKQPHGMSNPGGFDFEAWLARNRMHATGYVVDAPAPVLVQQSGLSLTAAREMLRRRLLNLISDSPVRGLVLALKLGDQGEIDDSQWQRFTDSGTNHLFVVSGLHIGMLAGLGYAVSLLLFRMLIVPQRWPAQKCAAVAALLIAGLYSLLAGWGLAAQRAMIMLAAFMLGYCFAIRVPMAWRFIVALALVLTLNPLAATGAGFWLSFCAVAVLVASGKAKPAQSDLSPTHNNALDLVQNYAAPQWRIFLGLALPLLIWNGQVSGLAPLVNLLAIPVVGFLIVPLCLSGMVLTWINVSAAGFVLRGATALLEFAYYCLERLVMFSSDVAIVSLPPPAPLVLICAVLAISLLLLPLRLFPSWVKGILLLPLLWPMRQHSAALLELHVVDVGQGLAVLVRHHNYTLLYDTGASYPSGLSMLEASVMPLLRQLRITTIDTLVISHGDNDHAGGVPDLLANYPVQQIFTGDYLDSIKEDSATQQLCEEVIDWHIANLHFRFLHPSDGSYIGNDRSCVLQIRGQGFNVLLPGDISRAVERKLVPQYGETLQSDVMISPHHGSNTSSGYPWIKTVAPVITVHSAGYRNAFNHPAPVVQSRYANLGIEQLSTFDTGHILLRFYDGQVPDVVVHRDRYRRYWHYQSFSTLADK